MKLLLTSTGLENPALRRAFVRLLPCETARARALFIPTAAVNCDAIEVLPKCLEDLYGIGIRRENIVVYDLHEPMTEAEIAAYDCVYLCGGDTKYLAKRDKEARFGAVLRAYLAAGRGAVLGVSAGSMIFSAAQDAGIDLLPQALQVHCQQGSADGALPPDEVRLTNAQGILFEGENAPFILE